MTCNPMSKPSGKTPRTPPRATTTTAEQEKSLDRVKRMLSDSAESPVEKRQKEDMDIDDTPAWAVKLFGRMNEKLDARLGDIEDRILKV